MPTKVTITTLDWVPEFAHGYVRDIRIRWALEEIGRPYDVDTVPVQEKTPEHFSRQPFGQVPMLKDGDLSLFESGAILLHLSEDTALMPVGDDRARTVQWLIAGLNSVEPYMMQWAIAKFFDEDEAAAARFEKSLRERLSMLQDALAERDWLVDRDFTVADLFMADILRIPAANGMLDDLPKLAAYVERATARPAFGRAMTDHMAHWHAADAKKAAASA
ncbi:glutathione S-transferase family protein [Paracoccus saliphilus]|uniref:Glutathione S-transferase n=1 Tax=Paracoccus saliphilus TaxID=405559 RepID=A0AA46A4A4_9RHOB|nr:glutathione S-transferase family protein [Paracoccus saliphilus]WCR03679.1 glutathione S-transferase family protein [Paracoccus saliphilus]SIS57774.1 glutathione S-transferase [Paracoccus saliphilus]